MKITSPGFLLDVTISIEMATESPSIQKVFVSLLYLYSFVEIEDLCSEDIFVLCL